MLSVIVKGKKTENTLAKGSRKTELYALDPKYADGEVHQALVSICSSDIVILLVYVNDVVTTGNNLQLLRNLISQLSTHFSLKDMGSLHFFLSIKIMPYVGGIYLSQVTLLWTFSKKTMMHCARAIHTILSHKSDFHVANRPPVEDFDYESIVGGLEYLTLTRPNLTHVVNRVCQFMQAPINAYWQGVKSTSLQAGCVIIRQSKTGVCVFLVANCISWSSKKQHTVSNHGFENETFSYPPLHLMLSKLEVLCGVYCWQSGSTDALSNFSTDVPRSPFIPKPLPHLPIP
uniref:Reverse transcriptase Ty1/copia-type domain-containing protein n=1 Tax=Solanum lycopersicum TaxID=4081 RepID=A0A3Q7HLM5_SOLLC